MGIFRIQFMLTEEFLKDPIWDLIYLIYVYINKLFLYLLLLLYKILLYREIHSDTLALQYDLGMLSHW